MSRETKSVLIGTVVPVVAILAGVVVLAGSSSQVFGFPAVFAWLFLCMPLTAVCLQLAWRIDEPYYTDEDSQA